MNYIISKEMLECFKNSLKLLKKHAQFIIDDADESGYVLTKSEQAFVDKQKEGIVKINAVLEELEKVKGVD